MLRTILMVLCASVLLGGCGYHEGVVVRDEMAYVQLVGDWTNVAVQIDNTEPTLLKYEPDPYDPQAPPRQPALKYAMATGKHTIKLYREGRLILDRVVFLSNQQTTEVRVP